MSANLRKEVRGRKTWISFRVASGLTYLEHRGPLENKLEGLRLIERNRFIWVILK
jgi:hypothetical protein